MYDSHIAILLTEKKINFPLLHMGIRSASAKIKRHLALSAPPAPVETVAQVEETKPEVETPAETNTATSDPELDSIMDQLLTELIEYFGPAAKFVFEDAVIQWETKYVRSKNNVPELGEFLQEELDTPEEKRAFSQFVTKILR